MLVFGIVHLEYKALRDLPSDEHSLWKTFLVGEPYKSIKWVCKNAVISRNVHMEM